MASVRETDEAVDAYWYETHGDIDRNSNEYRNLHTWAVSKLLSSRKSVTPEMVAKYAEKKNTPKSLPKALAAPKPENAPAMAPKLKPLNALKAKELLKPKAPKPTKVDPVKASLSNMYPLFGKRDGRGAPKKEDAPIFEQLKTYIIEQVNRQSSTWAMCL